MLAAPLGFHTVGVARVEPVSRAAVEAYRHWVDTGMNASMDYLGRYSELRNNPALLLEGAQSVIVGAICYNHPMPESVPGDVTFASYARGDDYHDVVRNRLERLATLLSGRYGGEYRPTVDTVPIRERYWAQRAGVGFIGRNSQLIIPGSGSYFFIGCLLSTVAFVPDPPCDLQCIGCNRCAAACPGQAIDPDTHTVDARRCHSYLTIEHRGPLPADVDLGNRVYGCDICQQVCPHNADAPISPVAEFAMRPAIASLTAEGILAMTQEQFSTIFRRSAVKRAKLAGLQRNAAHILSRRGKC